MRQCKITKTSDNFVPRPIIVVVDEMNEVMNSNDYKATSQITDSLGSIARLGRAAACHLVLATQRPSSNTINNDLKNNIDMKVLLGNFDTGASTLIFDDDISHLAKPQIKGRGFIKSGTEISEFQSFWTKDEFETEIYGESSDEIKEEVNENIKNQDLPVEDFFADNEDENSVDNNINSNNDENDQDLNEGDNQVFLGNKTSEKYKNSDALIEYVDLDDEDDAFISSKDNFNISNESDILVSNNNDENKTNLNRISLDNIDIKVKLNSSNNLLKLNITEEEIENIKNTKE